MLARHCVAHNTNRAGLGPRLQCPRLQLTRHRPSLPSAIGVPLHASAIATLTLCRSSYYVDYDLDEQESFPDNFEEYTLLDAEEYQKIKAVFEDLRRRFRGQHVPLQVLNFKLQQLHEELGISMKKVKQVIRRENICLYNSKKYKTQAGLRQALKARPEWVVRLHHAKHHPYCKMCLIKLWEED